MPKVVILGNSGSGKSTLARALAERFGAAHLDLDTLAWDEVNPTQRQPLDTSRRPLADFMRAHERWIIEGCYADLLAGAAKDCTRLVFLNPGTETCVANCRARPWEPHKYSSAEAQGKNLTMLIGWVREYETREDEFSLVQHRALFDGFAGSKIELTSNVAISAFAAAAGESDSW